MEVIDSLSNLLETAKTNLKAAGINSIVYNNETIPINNIGFKHIATAIDNIQLDRRVHIETGIQSIPLRDAYSIYSLSHTFSQLNKIYYVIVLCPYEETGTNSLAEGYWAFFNFLSDEPTVLGRRWFGVTSTTQINPTHAWISSAAKESDNSMVSNFSINNTAFSATFHKALNSRHYYNDHSFNILIIGLGE